MKHQITEEELSLNPQLEVKAGDKVDEKDLIYRSIPNNPIIGSKVEAVIARANPSHFENNKINVVDGEKVIRTYSGETDGLNWKKYAEVYADANGYELAPYSASLSERAGIQADSEAQAEEQRMDEEARREQEKAARPSRARRAVRAVKRAVRKVRGK